MNILITAMHYPVASGRYVAAALKRLGHEVRSLGPAMGNQLWGCSLPPEYAWLPDPPLPGWVPDLVLHMDGNWCPDAAGLPLLPDAKAFRSVQRGGNNPSLVLNRLPVEAVCPRFHLGAEPPPHLPHAWGRLGGGHPVSERLQVMVAGQTRSSSAGEVAQLAGDAISPGLRPTSPASGAGLSSSAGEVARIPHVVYGVDNHVRDYRFPGVTWDHLFLAHGLGYCMDEANMTWLPCAHDPVWFTPGPPLAERSITLAMIGVLYPARSALLAAIRAALPEAHILAGTGAVYGDYAAAYQDAQISLVRSVAGDVAQRVFETAAMGCLVVMDACPDAALLGLIDGGNCLIYRTPTEAVARIRWALDHLVEAQQIASAGQAWAQMHTWDARAAVIVDWAQQQRGRGRAPARARSRGMRLFTANPLSP